jgi:hypothetical protein
MLEEVCSAVVDAEQGLVLEALEVDRDGVSQRGVPGVLEVGIKGLGEEIDLDLAERLAGLSFLNEVVEALAFCVGAIAVASLKGIAAVVRHDRFGHSSLEVLLPFIGFELLLGFLLSHHFGYFLPHLGRLRFLSNDGLGHLSGLLLL